MEQFSFAKTKPLEKLPYLIELQKTSYENFLQKDIPHKERKWQGIHGAFLDIFGMAGRSVVYLENLPEDSKKRKDAIRLIAKITKKNIKDVERITNFLPSIIIDDIDDNEAKKVKSELEEAGITVKVVPQGITNNNENLILQYNGYKLLPPKYPLYDYKHAKFSLTPQLLNSFIIEDCKHTKRTYESKLVVNFRLIKMKQSGEPTIIEEDVYLADIPLMTPTGSFIINGAERVVVTQIHRSPGVIFEEDEENDISQYGKRLYRASIIPYRGSWLEFLFDSENILYVSIDKRRKILVSIFLRALGLSAEEIINIFCITEEISVPEIKKIITEKLNLDKKYYLAEQIIDKTTGEVIDVFTEINELIIDKLKDYEKIKIISLTDENLAIVKTLESEKEKNKGNFFTYEEAAKYIYKILQQQLGFMFVDFKIAKNYLENLFFSARRYDLSKSGRYKINRKLKPVFNEMEKMNLKEIDFEEPALSLRTLTITDILATIKYLLKLNNDKPFADGTMPQVDDIDHLGNRHIRPVGEQLESQVRIGLLNLARLTREQMNNTKTINTATPKNLINNAPLVTAIKKFFATGELSQFLDQTNILSDITSKRRLSALGPGGLNRKHAGFEVRDVHYTHYGRICPIETPEGANIGLITSLALYARVNQYGMIETPYRKVKDGVILDEVEYLSADMEDEAVIAPADVEIENNRIKGSTILARVKGEIKQVDVKEVNYIDISPQQMLSLSASLIPFLEHDDSNRALMGTNMQRQAVPLLFAESPLVATGIESKIAEDALGTIVAKNDGEVLFVDASQIVVLNKDSELDYYYLPKYQRSNQDTCVNYVPIVKKGQKVHKGDVLADSSCTQNGQLALGKNVLVAFMSFEGYNFEDAILISERLVKEDVFTSITITEFETDARETKLGPEEITRDIPGLSEEMLRNLDSEGIVILGTEVKPGDVLVGKVTPAGEQIVTVEEKLLQAIFGKKLETGKDVSLVVPPGVKGKVIWRQVLTTAKKLTKNEKKKLTEELKTKYQKIKHLINLEKEKVLQQSDKKYEPQIKKYYEQLWQEYEVLKEKEKKRAEHGDELPLTVIKSVKVYIASLRKIQVGDKLSGRHGNKGVVAKILPVEDMPFLPDGTPVDIVLSPLGIPSRMNVGQLLETMLGWAAKSLNLQYIVPPFEGATEEEVRNEIRRAREVLIKEFNVKEKYLPDDNGKITLYDGRTGEPFKEKCLVGVMYLMKLIHMVEDKIHARSTGPYSLVTKQPLGGRAHSGGQRFGEMEVWALEGYGAAYTLQEFLTIKSDDVVGRRKVYESIIKGEPITYIGVPESFKVLTKELQALALNIEILSKKYKAKELAATKIIEKTTTRKS